MSKSYLDDYIGEYIFYYFQDMRNPFIPRDGKLEKKISQAYKAEWILQHEDTINKNDLFKITPQFPDFKKVPSLPLMPCLNKYCTEHKMSLDQALQNITPKIQDFNAKMKALSDKERNSVLNLMFTGFIYHKSNSHNIAFMTNNSGTIESTIDIHYFQYNKILLSAFQSSFIYKTYFFNPYYKQVPLFNQYYLSSCPDATVILTDSIELAKKNQFFLSRQNITDVVWVSWHGGFDAIEKVKWTPLRGSKVYYLLKEHSGMGTRQVYETALKVKEALSDASYYSLSYISLLPDPTISDSQSMEISHSPLIWDNRIFLQYAKHGYTRSPYNYDIYLEKQRILEYSDSRIVFKPFLYSRCVTLLYGARSAKTWVALSVAVALKYGEKLWDGCLAPKSGSVLLIHGRMETSEMLKRLDKLESQYSMKSSDEHIMSVSIPEIVGAGNISITSDIQLVSHKLQSFQKKFQKLPTLIILDSLLFIDKLRKSPGKKAELNAFITSMRILGCSVLIVHNIPDTERGFSTWKKNLEIDSMVKLTKEEPLIPSRIAIGMSIRSGLRDLSVQNYQQLEIDLNDASPKWKLITDKRSKQEEMALINRLLWKGGLGDADIARALNLTEDIVKKRKAELRKDYKNIVMNAFQKKGLLEHQISTQYNIAPQLVATIVKKGSSQKKS